MTSKGFHQFLGSIHLAHHTIFTLDRIADRIPPIGGPQNGLPQMGNPLHGVPGNLDHAPSG